MENDKQGREQIPFQILYNKRIPSKREGGGPQKQNWQLRESCGKLLRGEAKNVVYQLDPRRPDHAKRLYESAYRYVYTRDLPLQVIRRGRWVFIQIDEEAEKRKRKERSEAE